MPEPQLLTELSSLFKEKHRIYVLYGRRGSGKTLLLLQLMTEILKKEGNITYLSLVKRQRDERLLSRFKRTLGRKTQKKAKIHLQDETELIEEKSRFLKHVIYDIFSGNAKSPNVFLDDIFSVKLLNENFSAVARQFSLMYVLLIKCACRSKRIFITVPENSQLLPFYWKTLIEFDPLFLRLRKARKLRDLFQVTLRNMPTTGEKWVRDKIKIQAEHLALLKLSKSGWFSILKKSSK